MEDYIKALEWVKRISKYGEHINGNRNWSNNADKYIPFLEKTLEKQIPKNVVFVHPLQDDDNGDYMCPTCKSGTVYDAYGNKPPYCHYCGQAIKWK